MYNVQVVTTECLELNARGCNTSDPDTLDFLGFALLTSIYCFVVTDVSSIAFVQDINCFALFARLPFDLNLDLDLGSSCCQC